MFVSVVILFVLVCVVAYGAYGAHASLLQGRRKDPQALLPIEDDLDAALFRLEQDKRSSAGAAFAISFDVRDSPDAQSPDGDSARQVLVHIARQKVPRFFSTGGPALRGSRRWRLAAVHALTSEISETLNLLVTQHGTRFKDGQISFSMRVGSAHDVWKLNEHVDTAIVVLDGMAALAPRLPQWLAQRMRQSDRRETYRSLLALLRYYPRHQVTRTAINEALKSRLDSLRLVAALTKDDATLQKIAAGIDVSKVEGGQWRKALKRLRDAESPTLYLALLQRSLNLPHAGLLGHVLDELARLGEPPDPRELEQSMGRFTARVTARLLRELEPLNGPRLEPLLITVLARRDPFPPDAFAPVRTSAARLLEQVGSISCVQALRKLAHDNRTDRRERHAVQEAIAAIAKRVGPGGLALVSTGEQGALAVAAEGGELGVVASSQDPD